MSDDPAKQEPPARKDRTALLLMPMAIGYWMEAPEDLLLGAKDSPRRAMLRSLPDSPAFAILRSTHPEELEASSMSLALVLGRAEYHEARFLRVVTSMEERRRRLRVAYTNDFLAKIAIYEAGAALGAARALVDELVYLVARRAGVTSQSRLGDQWQPKRVFGTRLPVPNDVAAAAETVVLRRHVPWFETLNMYRNVLHHRGWRDPTTAAYMPRSYSGPGATDPDANVFLVPDQASATGRPHEWTYTQGGRLETLVGTAMDGLRLLLEEVARDVWQLGLPAPGTAPELDDVNLFLRLPEPAVIDHDGMLVAPFFTSEANAKRMGPQHADLRLARLPIERKVFGEAAFCFSIYRLKGELKSRGSPSMLVMIAVDPVPDVGGKLVVNDGVTITVEEDSFKRPGGVLLKSLPLGTVLYCWSST